ncbi:MAG TPA: lamin tail domain-containing protein [Candidatus Paceibacterota bacterium]|nr:lamin tail domain-containing protein [Candidatus Paceibacterota bacterium]HRY76691.1 lamin tail domain-containing protein [Candidatus Paceibacterota bacterium]
MYKKLLILLILLFSFFSAHRVLSAGSIIINEVMYDLEGSDDNREWVEIKNISSAEIDLAGWKFNDGSNHNLNLPPKNGGQGSLLIPSGGYAILADKADVFLSDHPGFSGIVIDTVMSLSNTAEILKVIDVSGQVIEEINYDNGLGANGDGYSLERISENNGQFCPAQNFGGSPDFDNSPNCSPKLSPTATTVVTPNFSATPAPDLNASLVESVASTETPKAIVVQLIINEFIPNPVGSDEENEWIEIYNAGQNDVALLGWKLQDASGKAYNFDAEEIKAKSYLVLSRNTTKISINNDAEALSLIAPDSTEAFKISFTAGSKEGYSFSRFGSNDWRWTNILTPGEANQYSDAANPSASQDLNSNSPQPSLSAEAVGDSVLETNSFSMKKIVILAVLVGLLFGGAALTLLKKYFV